MVKTLKYLIIAFIVGILYLICFNLFLKVASAGMRPAGGGAGTVTSVTATSPLTSTEGTTPDIALPVTAAPTLKGLTLTYGVGAATGTFTYDISVGSITISGDTITDFAGDNLSVTAGVLNAAAGTPEGTAVLSTGEGGGTKYLREDGDGTCSWQTPAGSGDLLADGSVPLTANWDTGAYGITASSFTADYSVTAATAVFSGTISATGITDNSDEATNLASGTTGTRPAGVAGDIRNNSSLGAFEVYNGSAWVNLIDSGDDLFLKNSADDTTTGLLTARDLAATYGVAAATGAFSGALTCTTIDTGGGALEVLPVLKDLVTTSPLTGGTDDILPGTDADITVALNYASTNLLLNGAGALAVGYDTTDFGVSGSSLTITDDGHAHTTTSISGLDISADTNLAVTAPVVLTDDTLSMAAATSSVDGYLNTVAWAKFIEKDINFTITSPSNVFIVNGSSVCVITKTPKAITITNIEVTCDDDPDVEPVMDLKYADAFIGFANPVTINSCTTAVGVLSDSSITSGAVAAGKCIYLNMHAQPEDGMKSMSFTISGVYQ